MKMILLALVSFMLIVSGCAHIELGKYCEGQFETDVNDSNFIKLNPPEPDDYNPQLEDWVKSFRCNQWVKRCEWHCVDNDY